MNRLKQTLSSLPRPTLPSSSPSDVDSVSPPLEPDREEALAARYDLASNLLAAFRLFQSSIAKPKPNPSAALLSRGKQTELPAAWVGEAMLSGSEAALSSRGEDAYGFALSQVGQLHLDLAKLATAYQEKLASGYLATLESRTNKLRTVDIAVKEAEKKRKTLEIVLTKIDKGKKDASEYEHELDNAQFAYDTACRGLAREVVEYEAAAETDTTALVDLVDVHLEFANGFASRLADCKRGLQSLHSSSAGSPRSSHQAPPLPTRMSRSYSDSSVRRGQSTPPSASFSSLGPNRQRSNTLSSQTSEKDKHKLSPDGDLSEANRSRSSSFLERFALGNKGRTKSDDAQRETEGGSPSTEKAVSPARSGSTTPSRFTAPSMPAIPSLGSFKKLSIGSGSKYGTLGDAEQVLPVRSSRASAPTKRPAPPFPERHRPASPAAARTGSIGSLYRAQWSYVPSSSTSTASSEDDSHDVSFDKGDVIRIEKEFNADWWSAVVVEGTWKGQRGTFPSAYFVRCEEKKEERTSSAPRLRAQRDSTGSEMTVSSEDGFVGSSTEDDETQASTRLKSSNPFGDD
ncbi:BAR adaptor protein [Rhodotorula toruloides]|uniref:BAR adaptor protein n=1 Tax=Rhodotorula toruloides TaxID=5286 RepID=A0A511KNN7_RHOTO|nr:BAR adaptor protein [Rhodotorula toruloides]